MRRNNVALVRIVVLLCTAMLVFAACGGDDEGSSAGGDSGGGGGGGGGKGIKITAEDNSFSPNEISAPAGSEVTVEFTNGGNSTHTFSSEDAGFDSGSVSPGDTKTVTFTMPDDETDWQCNIHGPSMSGTLKPEG